MSHDVCANVMIYEPGLIRAMCCKGFISSCAWGVGVGGGGDGCCLRVAFGHDRFSHLLCHIMPCHNQAPRDVPEGHAAIRLIS